MSSFAEIIGAEVTDIPEGLRPRLLNMLSGYPIPRLRSSLFKAKHFSFGVKASQDFVYLAGEDYVDLRDELVEFAPHPFEDYSFSLWVGYAGKMVEVICIVNRDKDGDYLGGMTTLPWGDESPSEEELKQATREVVRDTVHDEEEWIKSNFVAAWVFIDTFRLLLAKPNNVTINQGEPRRSTLYKGKRVNFYAASEITIDLDKTKFRVINQRTGHGTPPRLYEYRAHLCHSRLKPGCEHFWEPTETSTPEHPRWSCVKCDGRRWHRRAGIRGNADKGIVRQRYKVVKGDHDVVPA